MSGCPFAVPVKIDANRLAVSWSRPLHSKTPVDVGVGPMFAAASVTWVMSQSGVFGPPFCIAQKLATSLGYHTPGRSRHTSSCVVRFLNPQAEAMARTVS